MALKTAIRSLYKYLPKTAEQAIAEALESKADMGEAQVTVFDQSVTDALTSTGLLPPEATPEPASDGAQDGGGEENKEADQ